MTPSERKRLRWAGRWQGQTVVCIASGPSLAAEDCERVRHLPCIVTNTTVRMVPWAQVLMAFDGRWWVEHGKELGDFKGDKVTLSPLGLKHGAETLHGEPWFQGFGNSGTAAVSLAILGGAAKVILLGFDCSKAPDGQTHWHGDHPKSLTNAISIGRWPKLFDKLAKHAERAKVPVLNCSRRTILTVFPRCTLDEALA